MKKSGLVLVIVKVDIPVHATTERFVLRLTTTTQRVVLAGGPLSALLVVALGVFERDGASDAIGAILGDRDGRLAWWVHIITPLDAIKGIAQRSGGTILHRRDNLLTVSPIGIDK